MIQNFALILNLASILTSEVAPRSAEVFIAYYYEVGKVARSALFDFASGVKTTTIRQFVEKITHRNFTKKNYQKELHDAK